MVCIRDAFAFACDDSADTLRSAESAAEFGGRPTQQERRRMRCWFQASLRVEENAFASIRCEAPGAKLLLRRRETLLV